MYSSIKLKKSVTDRSLHGVCGGIAEYIGVSSFVVRVLFLFIPGCLLIYIILANTLPDSPRTLN
ncbi:phage shock protein C (PspC) family protein [Gracilibacillus ureilyticus]|uniref:Phage shock protein C (PspC) family protein n=1 Tax=Gracilibacillus ureilyticus TaxID=531814 RepID=A0A1H9VUQ3_9BACI|nr:PspC domain-containing protein [Gracilibacillus ureilyticus]SES25258.1 phage shock protein C (PspC) family protein [Gracilibacillus ureilyticus]